MELAIGVFVYVIVISLAALSAYGLQRIIKTKVVNHTLAVISVMISLLIIWYIDLAILLNESLVRELGVTLNYTWAILAALLKYFGLCMVIFGLGGSKAR